MSMGKTSERGRMKKYQFLPDAALFTFSSYGSESEEASNGNLLIIKKKANYEVHLVLRK
jgi:hypothetical protein